VTTDCGDPNAQRGPLTERSGCEALVADGSIVVGSGRPLAEVLACLDDAAELPSGSALSDAFAALRRNER
jgi:hypothetical protein